MISNLLQHFSAWNAQFFREVKGRLKPRNVYLTASASFLIQSLILLYFWVILPGRNTPYSQYCTGKKEEYSNWRDCLLNSKGYPQIDWQTWWFDIFQVLSWLLPLVVLVAGVYMLITDLGKEERRGTLNFIRLSPQTSRSVLVGKLLGVPLIPWLAVLLAVPLHIFVAFQAKVLFAEVVSIYLVTITACCFFYTAAVFYAFLGATPGWLGAIAVWICYSAVLQAWNLGQSSTPKTYLFLDEWFYIKIGYNLELFIPFVVGTFAIATCWNWLAINRRFRNPNQVVLSKRQSYWMTLFFELFILGFALRTYPNWGYRYALTSLIGLMVVNLLWFILIIAALTPHRQTLLDWARYRKDGVAKNQRKQWRRALLRDLLWGDRSPAIVAIALNLIIPILLFTPWILTWTDQSPRVAGFLSLIFSAAFLLICAMIAQSILFGKSKHQTVVAMGLLGCIIVLPPIMMVMIGAYPKAETSFLWLFSAFPFAAMEYTSAMTIAFGLLVYLSGFTMLVARHTHQLKRAGESELKALMAHRSQI